MNDLQKAGEHVEAVEVAIRDALRGLEKIFATGRRVHFRIPGPSHSLRRGRCTGRVYSHEGTFFVHCAYDDISYPFAPYSVKVSGIARIWPAPKVGKK